MNTQQVYCGQCKNELQEQPNITENQRSPCPFCGSKTRDYTMTLEERIDHHEFIKGKSFPPGSKKWIQKAEGGNSLYQKNRRMEHVESELQPCHE